MGHCNQPPELWECLICNFNLTSRNGLRDHCAEMHPQLNLVLAQGMYPNLSQCQECWLAGRCTCVWSLGDVMIHALTDHRGAVPFLSNYLSDLDRAHPS